jgi:hypothetical protein
MCRVNATLSQQQQQQQQQQRRWAWASTLWVVTVGVLRWQPERQHTSKTEASGGDSGATQSVDAD